MKKILSFLIVAILVLSACGGNNGKKVTIGVASNDTKAWEKVKELAKKDDVTEVIVYEIEKDIVDLYYTNFGDNPKIKVINEDAYKVTGERFDFFYVDIYEYKLTKQVVDDYNKFNELHDIKEYLFWGVEHFLLSCKYEEIVWVYIPEIWMEISKNIFIALQDSNLLEYYRQLDEELVSSVLAEFKAVLD